MINCNRLVLNFEFSNLPLIGYPLGAMTQRIPVLHDLSSPSVPRFQQEN